MFYIVKVSSEANLTNVWKQLNNLVITFVTHCHGNVCAARAAASPSGF